MAKPQRKVNSAATDYNALAFQIQRALSEISTAEPVTVGAVDIPDPKGPVGFVDVTPLTKIVDGEGKGMAQETQYKLPYRRYARRRHYRGTDVKKSLTDGVRRGSAFERQGRVLGLCPKIYFAPVGAEE